MIELLLRLTVGTFFAISGFHKLFVPSRHQSLVDTFKEDGVPWVRFNQWFVPLIEFFGGLAVACGFLTPLAALGLLAICVVATAVDGLKRVQAMHPLNAADRLCCGLYLPEVTYAVILICLIVMGGGPYSIDALLLKWLGYGP